MPLSVDALCCSSAISFECLPHTTTALSIFSVCVGLTRDKCASGIHFISLGDVAQTVKYFEMQKKQCKDALEIYKRFLTRMDRVTDFLKLAESVGVPRGEIPDLTKAPASLLDALEQHLEMMEGRKPTSPSSTVNPYA